MKGHYPPPIPVGGGAVDTNDWCIINLLTQQDNVRVTQHIYIKFLKKVLEQVFAIFENRIPVSNDTETILTCSQQT